MQRVANRKWSLSAPPSLRVKPVLELTGSQLPLLILGCLCLLFTGCPSSSGPPRYKITGKVTFQGQPVEEGTITFDDPALGQPNQGELGPGGAYSTELLAGSYKVSVTPPLVETKPTADTPPDLVEKNVKNIPKKYRRQETSGLTADVSKDKRTFDFDLK